MPTFDELSQKHEDYREEEWEVLDDLYVGGFRMKKNARRHLFQLVGEHTARYEERVSCAGYINYLGQIIDAFVANVFTQELSVTPAVDAEDTETEGDAPAKPEFYKEFERDADLCGTSFDKVIRDVFTEALIKGRGVLAIDLPNTASPDVDAQTPRPSNRLDEERLGLDRVYVWHVPTDALIDWEFSGPNFFKWCVLHKKVVERDAPGASNTLYHHEFKVWKMTGPDGSRTASWTIWQTSPKKLDEPTDGKEELTIKASGDTTFDRIPIMCLDIPSGLWIGNKIGPLAMELFQRRNQLISAQNRSLFAIPVVKLDSEYAAPGHAISDVQTDSNRLSDGPLNQFTRKGFSVIGAGDSIEFAEPSGAVYEIVDAQLEKVVTEMYRTVHNMSTAVAGKSMYRSGKSKIEDRHSMEIILGAYGSLVRQFAKEIYELVSLVRGDDVIWAAHGMDMYELEDRDLLIKEGAFVDSFNIPSKTFKKAHKFKLALALVGNVPAETKQQIRREIGEGVEEDMDHEELQDKLTERMLEEQLAAPKGAYAPQPAPPPGAAQPGKKTPQAVGVGKVGTGSMVPADSKTHHPHDPNRKRKSRSAPPA